MLMLRVNVVVFIVVTTLNVAVFLLAMWGFLGGHTLALLEIMGQSSIGFVAVTLACCYVDSGEIESDDEVVHPAGFYILMALGYTVSVAAYAWATFGAMAVR